MCHSVSTVLLVAFALTALPTTAHAYLNPDSGSILLQALLGGAAGLAVAIKLLWHRIAGLFSRVFARRRAQPEADR